MSKKNILTGHVSRVINGVPVILGPGDPAPDWVTNPALLASAATNRVTEERAPASKAKPAEDTRDEGNSAHPADGLDALNIKTLRTVAEDAGLAKSGSKQDLIDRIRATSAVDAPAKSDTEDSDAAIDGDRDQMLAKAADLGIEDADHLTDAELQAALENEE